MGYVGLTTAACFARRRFVTIGIDKDRGRIERLKKGEAPLHEPGLQPLVRDGLRSGSLNFSSKIRDASSADIIFVAVGTPSRKDGSIDLSQVRGAARGLGAALRNAEEKKTVVLRSTVVPGTTSGVFIPALSERAGKRANVVFCYNPEFMAEGRAVQDTFHPGRIVIGAKDPESWHGLASFYHHFYGFDRQKMVTTTFANAEMIKYASNAFLAMKVSFINQIANLCSETPGCDVQTVAEALGMDRRISPLFLRAGLGYGGSCFGKDMRALSAYAKRRGVELPLVDATLRMNSAQASVAVKYAEEELGGLRGKKVALLGLSFKPGTDDIREAVSLRVVDDLLEKGARVVSYDPAAKGNAQALLGDRISFAGSPEDCIEGADCAILVTEWDEFKRLTPLAFKRAMKRPLVIDGRRIYSPKEFAEAGVAFRAVGLSKRRG
jgi:UDPglucose 6-dehydrogenase